MIDTLKICKALEAKTCKTHNLKAKVKFVKGGFTIDNCCCKPFENELGTLVTKLYTDAINKLTNG
jgi:hypothetical protein